jgi:hypothetical protein
MSDGPPGSGACWLAGAIAVPAAAEPHGCVFWASPHDLDEG